MPKEETQGTVVVFNRQQTDLTTLPKEIQDALAKFKTREAVGVAPVWKPKKDGDFIIGKVTASRIAGKYNSTIITLSTPAGHLAVWLNQDLKLKLGTESLVGRNLVIQYEGMLLQKDNPNIKKDMKMFKVIEVEES